MAKRNRGRKQRSTRTLSRRILVVTEGEVTEPQYVEHLNQFLRTKGVTADVKVNSVGRDPESVVRKCIQYRDSLPEFKKYDFYVCLVDVDQHSTLEKACSLAKRESILLLISNLKFEVWLRWHKVDKRSQLSSKNLDRETEQLGLIKNKKISGDFPYDAVHQACDIARQADKALAACRVGPNPSSAMPILVDLLMMKR